MEKGNAIYFVKLSVDVAYEPIATRQNLIRLFFTVLVITSPRQRLELPRLFIDRLEISATCRGKVCILIRPRTRDVVYSIEISLCLPIFGPSDSLCNLLRPDLLKKEVQSFPLFFVELQAVDSLFATLYLLKLVSA